MTNTITPLEFGLRDERNRAEVTVKTPPLLPTLSCSRVGKGTGGREGERGKERKGTCAASGQSADVSDAGPRARWSVNFDLLDL